MLISRLTSNPRASALLFGLAVWLSGLAAFGWIGQANNYLASVLAYGWLVFIPVMIIGLQYFHSNYSKEIAEFRPYLKVSTDEYDSLRNLLDRQLCNPLPVLVLGIDFMITLDDTARTTLGQILMGDLVSLNSGRVWNLGLSALNWLLLSTAIWLVISTWLGIFAISQRSLNFTPARFSHEFHGLAILNLKTTGFYFLGLAIPAILNLYLAAGSEAGFNVFSLAFFYVLIIPGVVGFFAPHFNIHRALKSGKETELERIDKEIQVYAAKLQELHLHDSSDLQEYVKLSSRLIALQAHERRIAEADDWPLDHTMITVFAGLVIFPILTNFITVFL